MRTSERAGGFVPILLPNLPSLCFEVGSREALRHRHLPNLPNLPSLFRVPVHVGAHMRAPARAHTCTTSKKGWEGWEGWEEQAVERISGSQPVFGGWEGWEGGWDGQRFVEGKAMRLMVDKLRADFALVALQHRESGAWSRDDEAAIGQTIAKAVQADDQGTVLTWARWMGAMAAEVLLDWPVVAAKPEVRLCADCKHFAKPGRSDGYCHGREDLARAYGPDHPFRVLPADGGASCVRFVRAH